MRDAAVKEVDLLNELKRDATHATTQAQDLNTRIEKAETELGACKDRLANYPITTFDEERLTAVSVSIQSLEALSTSLDQDRGKASQVDSLNAQMDTANEVVQRVGHIAEAAIDQLQLCKFDDDAHIQAEDAAEAARTQMQDARVEEARAVEAHQGAVSNVSLTKVALVGYDTRAIRLREVEADHQLHEKCDARLNDFRIAVAATTKPEMTELMSGLVNVLTDGKHEAVELTEDFTPILYESGIACEVISGGCKNVAALAQRLAISQMHAERSSNPTGLLMLDEIFGSLDPNRRANVQALIQHFSSVFPQMIAISHIPETKDAVDNVVELVFDEGARRTRVAV